jgi:hypothetical protein
MIAIRYAAIIGILAVAPVSAEDTTQTSPWTTSGAITIGISHGCELGIISMDNSVTIDWACVEKEDADFNVKITNEWTLIAHLLKAVRDGKAKDEHP